MQSKGLSLLKALLLFILLIGVISYLYDCIVNFEYAIKNLNFLLLYIVDYLFRSWLFILVFICYFLIFKNLDEKRFLLFKIIYMILFSALYARCFYMDDYSLSNLINKGFKLFVCCSISSMMSMLYLELYMYKGRKQD